MRIRVQINTPREIGTLVKLRRKEVGLSQTALASLVGASRQWVQNLEGGKAGLELGLTIRALAALGLRLDARPVEPPVTPFPREPGTAGKANVARGKERLAPEATGGVTWQAPWERAEILAKRANVVRSVNIHEIVDRAARKAKPRRP